VHRTPSLLHMHRALGPFRMMPFVPHGGSLDAHLTQHKRASDGPVGRLQHTTCDNMRQHATTCDTQLSHNMHTAFLRCGAGGLDFFIECMIDGEATYGTGRCCT
jgi:hypothetical protein